MLKTPLVLRDLRAEVESGAIPWAPFRPGVQIHRLHGGGPDEPAAALLQYAPGARVPRHRHTGYEHVFVVTGAQSDERGRYAAGTLIVNPPGSTHSVASDEGCVVLVIWERPVQFEADIAS